MGCFCESGNLLSQWRAYADRGGGYSIGFKFSSNTLVKIELDNFNEGHSPHLRKVIYDPGDQQRLVRNYIESVKDCARRVFSEEAERREPNRSIRPQMMALQSSNILLDMLLSFKHPAFQEEHEWRLVYV